MLAMPYSQYSDPNMAKQDWIRGVTGYQGGFGSGDFGRWGQSNGWDARTLTNVWNQMQPMFQNQPSYPQNTGLLGNHQQMGGLLSGYQPINYGWGQPISSRVEYPTGPGPMPNFQMPGPGGFGGPANSGHSFMWSP